MTRIFEVEHRPELCVGVRLGDLIQGRVVLIDNLVNGAHDSCVFDRPAEIAARLASDDIALALVLRQGRDRGGRAIGPVGREELGDAQIALG